jgi:hypothetical protein
LQRCTIGSSSFTRQRQLRSFGPFMQPVDARLIRKIQRWD